MPPTNHKTAGNQEHDPDALTFLRDLIQADPEGATHLAQERLRVRLTDGLRQARFELGLSQRDMAQRLGTSQARVSHIESAGRDRRLDTLVAYTEALGADLLLALRVGDRIIEVSRPEGTRIVLVQELIVDAFGGGPATFDRSSLEAPLPHPAPVDDDEPPMLELAA
jgi:transcriptional regulator with XRE-family HTH domain